MRLQRFELVTVWETKLWWKSAEMEFLGGKLGVCTPREVTCQHWKTFLFDKWACCAMKR